VSREPETKAHYSLTPPTKWNRGYYEHPLNKFEQALTPGSFDEKKTLQT